MTTLTDLSTLRLQAYLDSAGRLRKWAQDFVADVRTDTPSLLKDISNGVAAQIVYEECDEEAAQTPVETLARSRGLCRDFAVLFVDAVRSLGFGARIMFGFLYDPNRQAVGPAGAGWTHAWAEVYVPTPCCAIARTRSDRRGSMTDQSHTDMPREIADRVTKPFARFLKIEAAAGGLLLLAALSALVLANSAWSTPFLAFWETPIGLQFGALDFSRSLRHWINDGLMTFFFFVISLELKRELVLGELRNLRTAALPFAAALGGMLVPVSLYLALTTGQPGMHGWGTVMATDTAFVIGCLALFGSRIPPALRLFLLSLAIFDDVGAILVVAVGYGEALNWPALALGMLGLGTVAGAARLGIRSIPVYFLLGGVIWLCFDASGVHATIAGVVLGLMTPTRVWVSDARLRSLLGRVLAYPTGEHWSGDTADRRDLRQAGRAVAESLSPVERLEMMLHPWVGFAVMPVFALANAGVAITGADLGQSVSLAIIAGLVLGKPVGVLGFSWLAVRLGLAAQAPSLSWPFLTAGAFLTGIGFTMSLFIAGLAYAPAMLDAAKLGILAGSVCSAAVGILVLVWLTLWKRPFRDAA